MFRVTAFYGQLWISSCIPAEDIESATISAQIAYTQADMIVVEGC
jgi:hypothetical protein